MKIIINSDILYTGSLIKNKVPDHWGALLVECRKSGHSIIIPQTVLLEFDRQQSEYVRLETKRLKEAYALLDMYKIPHTTTEPSALVSKPDLIKLIKDFGVEVIVEEPSYDDFKEAHKRACLHEAPGSSEQKHDEMRDLVIWVMALRVASKDKKALLISNDEVHSGHVGNEEASSVGLERVTSMGDALGFFGLDSPSGVLIKSIIQPIWGDLLKAGLPLEKTMSMIGVSDPAFIQGIGGIGQATCLVRMKTSDGKILKANLKAIILLDVIEDLLLTDIRIAGSLWHKDGVSSLQPRKRMTMEKDDFEERLRALKTVVGGKQ
ncbi:MAG: PIN domain-containing protein [Methanothrix sp.]|nr:PIN domain-containing protein [Methanothrix sp.]